MKKNTKKIVIGLVSIILLFGIYYLYSIYNTGDLDNYCKQSHSTNNKTNCVDDFIQKCKSTGGEMLSKEKCDILPPNGDCLNEAFSHPIFHYGCCYTNNVCKCPFGKGWDKEKGCTFF